MWIIRRTDDWIEEIINEQYTSNALIVTYIILIRNSPWTQMTPLRKRISRCKKSLSHESKDANLFYRQTWQAVSLRHTVILACHSLIHYYDWDGVSSAMQIKLNCPVGNWLICSHIWPRTQITVNMISRENSTLNIVVSFRIDIYPKRWSSESMLCLEINPWINHSSRIINRTQSIQI